MPVLGQPFDADGGVAIKFNILCGNDIITPCACAGGKVISRVVVVVVSTKIAIYRDLGTWATRKHRESINLAKNWLQYVSNRSTSVRNSAFFLAIVATPMSNAYSMHTGLCFLLMRTTKWPTIRTGKDRRHVLNNARDTDCYPIDWNVKPCGTESDCK